ncbi:ABC transporter substrate-binding protein [Demequina sp. SYSU T00068]|uniref:ABC transporter substrate-binding protein n=1 Tax=Demequina lignilytica TaxID=3051663 RepID=UPI002610CA05|nr:ABC transporter substrate-binding protein [Demequina sp. SYSU T00068]MDN4489559.1 ABC transporter substrate-binding protein [Demequina sp. SYSU T00068]
MSIAHRTGRRRALPLTVAGLAVSTLALAGCSGRDAAGADPEASATAGTGATTEAMAESCSPGFTDTEIRIGNSVPLSGPAAAYGAIGQTLKLYFDDINAAGGLELADGTTRQVNVTVVDDAYDPAKAATNVRQLVEQDEVFALAGVLGTGAAISVAPYISETGVPNLFVGTGSDAIMSLHADGTQWTTGFMPQYGFEVSALAQYLIENHPGETAAILYQNDDFGESIKAGFEAAFEGSGIEIVAAEPYEVASATVDSQVTTLAASDADIFLNWAVGAFATQSLKKKLELGWDATTVINAPAADATFFLKPAGEGAADGVVSVAYTKDITDPSLAGDAGFDAWAAFAAAHPDEVNAMFAPAAAGYQTAQLLEAALAQMEGCTREALLDAATSFDGLELDLAPVTVSTSPEYPYVFSEVKIQVFNGTTWDVAEGTYTVG